MNAYNKPSFQANIHQPNTSINTIRFFLNLRRFLLKNQLSLQKFLTKIIKLKDPHDINQVQFVKIVKNSQTNFQAMEIYQVFNQLKYGPTIKTNNFISKYQMHDKNHPIQKTNEIQQQSIKIRNQNTLSQAEKQMEKKLMRLGLLKLQRYVRENQPFELFTQYDDQGKGYLTKPQFNKFLCGTDVKELHDKNIRHVLMRKLFGYYPDQRMKRVDFMALFKVDLEEDKKKQKQNKNATQPEIKKQKVQFNEPSSPMQNDANDFAQVQMKKKLNFEKKTIYNNESNDNQINQIKQKKYNQLQSPSLKFTKSQSFESHQGDILDARTAFPRSYGLYRLGIPHPDQFIVFQALQGYLQGHKVFVDPENPKTSIGQYQSSSTIFHGAKYQIFQMAASVLNRQKSRIGLAREIQPKDIIQGQIGDCYLLSSIASIISIYPEVISQRFLFAVNPSHFYAVKLFIDGEWITFCTDDQFPCQYKKPVYAKPHGNQIWVLLIQKCWAKAFGSYDKIDAGTPTEGFRTLTGAPTEYFTTQNQTEQKQMFNRLKQAYQKRYVTTASGSKRLTQLSQKQQDNLGLIADHAYSFLKFLNIAGQTVVKMRNPWGKTVWKGQWSFNSQKWSKPLRDQYNYNREPDDGSFYIPWNLFMKYFGCFVICRLVSTNIHTSYKFTSKPHKSTYLRVFIKQKGCYNFSVYQQSKRKCPQKNYEYSPVRLTVGHQSKGDIKYVTSITKDSHALFCQAIIQPGIYYVAIKIDWQQRASKPCVFSLYGQNKASIQQIQNQFAPFFKKGIIQSYAKSHPGKVKYYEKLKIPEAFNQTYFSLNQGLGYVRVKNPSKKGFRTTYSMNNCSGIKPIKPAKLPYKFDMKPDSEFIIGFWTNCRGYSYQSSESMETKGW